MSIRKSTIRLILDYLSNLRRLDEYKKIQLRNLIKSIPANAFSEWEWKDALQYLTETTFIQDMHSAYDVRQRLLAVLEEEGT